MLAAMNLDEVARARRDPGVVVLEGFHAVKHAVRFGAELLGLWTADAEEFAALVARLAPDIDLDPTVVEAEALAKVVPRAQVLAVARRPKQLDPDGILAQVGPAPVILLEEPRHLGNLGACVRVAAAAGAAGVITTGVQDPWHPDALRGSAGLHFALPVARSRVIRTGDRPLIALDPEGEPLSASAARARGPGVRHRARRPLRRAARARRRPPGAADVSRRLELEPRDRGLGRPVRPQGTRRSLKPSPHSTRGDRGRTALPACTGIRAVCMSYTGAWHRYACRMHGRIMGWGGW